MIPVLFGEGEPAGGGGFLANPMSLFLMFGLFMLFWVIVVLPAGRRQKKEQEQMLASLKPGARIVTTTGIIGKVVTAKDGEAEIVIRSEESKLKILRSAVLKVLGTDEAEVPKA